MVFIFGCIYSIFKRITSLIDPHPHVVLDSNTIFGKVVEHKYSPNGKFCAFTIDEGEPNSFIITVIDVETGNPYGKNLQIRTLKKIAWSGDSEGFFVYVGICFEICGQCTAFLAGWILLWSIDSTIAKRIKFSANFWRNFYCEESVVIE